MNQNLYSHIRDELTRRKEKLIVFSYDKTFIMDAFERGRIQSLLERGEIPERPDDIPSLIRQFCVSAFSYAPLRNNYLAPLIGGLPVRANIHKALSLAFDNEAFSKKENWYPRPLGELAEDIQKQRNFDLSSKRFQPRIIAVLLTGTKKLGEELQAGLEDFYDRIEGVREPDKMWQLVTDFARAITQVGPALICDFFKEIGFSRYIKVDHHFNRQFPTLLGGEKSCRLSPKKSFILSQELADAVDLSPFHIDSILYLWGRYGDSTG